MKRRTFLRRCLQSIGTLAVVAKGPKIEEPKPVDEDDKPMGTFGSLCAWAVGNQSGYYASDSYGGQWE